MTALSPQHLDRVSQLQLLLLGERRSGKSSVGNVILGRKEFHTGSPTSLSTRRQGHVGGREVVVVDTPGWLPSKGASSGLAKELLRGLALCHPGPHAILLVIPSPAAFSSEAWRAMESYLRLLEGPIWPRALVLFTHAAELGEPKLGKEKSLLWLVERCGGRHHVVNGHTAGWEAQVSQLLGKVERMVEASRRPVELQQRLYTRVREDLWMEGKGTEEVTSGVRPAMEEPRGRSCVKPVIGLVLLGRRMSGKSLAGEIILDQRGFLSGKQTRHCMVGQGKVAGRVVVVVDTPGWSSFGMAQKEQVRQEISRSPLLCPPGSRLTFLLAVPVDSFSEGDLRRVDKYLSVLGEKAWGSMVVLFTYGSELKNRSIAEHIQQQGAPLWRLLQRCGQHYHVLDRRAEDRTQITELLEMVEKLQPGSAESRAGDLERLL